MAAGTREQFLDSAEVLFAERGFYGVSIAAIASELGLTKQALLHHFGSKEKLYGEVLRRISDQFESMEPGPDPSPADAGHHLKTYLLDIAQTALQSPDRTRLLMRELLDNKHRAERAGTWYLKPFLERLIGMVRAIPAWREAGDADALALVYQLLGAINYFGVSKPTLLGIFGSDAYADLDEAFPQRLGRLIDIAISSPD
ncbi:MAG: TetR/AcrR family transcriptional regulator [Pseudomonadota bacterium]